MCKFSSKSGGVPFQISFFLGDLTRNDPSSKIEINFSFKGLLVASWSTVQRSQLILPALKSPPKMRVLLGLFLNFSEI